MQPSSRLFALVLTLLLPINDEGSPEAEPVAATVESSLGTSATQIRQFAFDGDPKTYFASATNPGASDHFTLVLDRPIALKSVEVTTGLPDGVDKLDAGSLEVSADGRAFDSVAKFVEGVARFEPKDRPIRSIRIRSGADSSHPLVVREIALDSAEPVATFSYPIEFTIDSADAPEMKEWTEKVARLCERWYSKLNEELKSEGYKPPTQISLSIKSDYDGVAEAGGNQIKGSVKFFKENPGDLGAMIHETCHVIQNYPDIDNPGWLVEGVCDYVRFFVYEPGEAGPVDPSRAHYDDSYRTTASFLAFVSEKYDKGLVLKLNALMRQGRFKIEAFKELTGKTVRELDREWLDSLRK